MDVKTQTMLNVLADQRNQAMDALVRATAEIADRDARIADLEAKLSEGKTPAPPTPAP